MPRLFLIAEIRAFREILAWRLSHENVGTVVGTAPTAPSALRAISELRPELVVVELSRSRWRADVRRIAAKAPGADIVGLAGRDPVAGCCDDAGIVSLVRRDASANELLSTLRRVLACGAPLRRERAVASTPLSNLTKREAEILALIDQGLSNKDIARRLYIEIATVKNHVHHILEKLHVHRRGQAAAIAAGRVLF